MTQERDKKMRLIVNENLETSPTSTNDTERVENKVYQSNPMKADLYSKLMAFRHSQKKFTIKDLINDGLK